MSRCKNKSCLETLALLLLMLAAGCGTKLTQKNYDAILTGMTLEEVEEILGPGKEVASSSLDIPDNDIELNGIASVQISGLSTSSKIVNWEERSKTITIIFYNGKVASKSMFGGL